MSKKYELEIMCNPRMKILGIEQVDVDFTNDGLYRITEDFHSYIFYGRTKEVCFKRATNHYYKEIVQKEKELNKLKSTYNKLIGMLHQELEKGKSE